MLTNERVHKVFMDCLFNDGEDTTGFTEGDGVMHRVGFHPGRLEESREEVAGMLAELSDDFKTDGGGGMSFLNACQTKEGNQWTGEHRSVDKLFTLGIALGLCAYLAPRRLWPTLPGGMPYIVVK